MTIVILFKDVVDLDCWTHTTKKVRTDLLQLEWCRIHYINANRPRSRIESVRVDNRWVATYNSYLCQKYDCHVNVEVRSTVQYIKYLYTYVYKGQDRATVVLRERGRRDSNDENNTAEERVDEIKQYMDTMYLSSLEVCWKISNMMCKTNFIMSTDWLSTMKANTTYISLPMLEFMMLSR
ncbi:LOW QUALITY PROTEIN: Helitron helicase [Phytophthora megakarya]|uniref:Helitron helicase n=1 Tax=Phytophthora megakarya TaxID=4795 RepID=A0A225W2A9_9STRA|nr:LOW QUALITY PROTEIN: Helitron helicase [Phytophthora megakarya]